MRNFFVTLLALLSVAMLSGAKPMRVIVETDMGNDIDDALAMDLVYKGVDDGLFRLLGVSNHKQSPTASEYIDILNTWYGYPKTPVAKASMPVANTELKDYTTVVCEMRAEDGMPLFKRTKTDAEIMESVEFYRKTLSAQPDGSVVIISLGFGTNLARLLESPADKYSKLDGRALVARKVRLLSIMAGSFGPKIRAEFNVINDVAAMQTVFDLWPTEVVMSPFELGKMIRYPASVVTSRFGRTASHPVIDGYKRFLKMPYNRPCWDLTSVAYLVDPDMFTVSKPGTITVDDKGYTSFKEEPTGRHRVMSVNDAQAQQVLDYIVNTTTRTPKRYR